MRIPNEEINQALNAKYSDEFLELMREWCTSDKDIVSNLSEAGTREQILSRVHRYINVVDKSVLEVGCGSGKNVMYWNSVKAGRIYTIDIDEFATKLSRARCDELDIKNVELDTGDFMSHSFNEKFDVISCVQVLEHVGTENQVPFIRKMTSLLNKNGILFIQVPNKSCPVDAHDSRLPFAHWLPRGLGKAYAKLFKRQAPVWDPMPYNLVKKTLEDEGCEILNRLDVADSLGEFFKYRFSDRGTLRDRLFALSVAPIYAVIGPKTNIILPNVNIFARKIG